MKVKQLIEILERLKPNATVCVAGTDDNGDVRMTAPRILTDIITGDVEITP